VVFISCYDQSVALGVANPILASWPFQIASRSESACPADGDSIILQIRSQQRLFFEPFSCWALASCSTLRQGIVDVHGKSCTYLGHRSYYGPAFAVYLRLRTCQRRHTPASWTTRILPTGAPLSGNIWMPILKSCSNFPLRSWLRGTEGSVLPSPTCSEKPLSAPTSESRESCGG
jgi:hypothetical protein